MSADFTRHPIDLTTLPPQLHKHLDPNAPVPIKMMAAQGMLPISAEQNITILYQLANFSDGEIKNIAEGSFTSLPDDILLLSLPKIRHAGILDWIAEVKLSSDRILEQIVMNSATSHTTVATLAKTASTWLSDIIATNQVRLLKSPEIIEKLYMNANTRMATIDRVLELAQREKIDLKGLPGLRDALRSGKLTFGDEDGDPDFDNFLQSAARKGEDQDALFEKSEGMSPSERARFFDEHIYVDPKTITKEMLKDALKSLQLTEGASFDAIKRAYKRFFSMEDAPTNLEEIAHAYKVLDTYTNTGPMGARISRMSISQKIRLATVGSRGEINILVKDPNPLVHGAACQSPRVKYPDIRSWSKNKAMPDAVVNYIASSKKHTKNKEIKYLLCMNPKTPLAAAIRFLNFLSANELKKIASDRNIPMQLRRQAKGLTNKRSGGKKK